MNKTISNGAVARFASRASRELQPQIPTLETTQHRMHRLRELGLSGGRVVELDWGDDIPNPDISAALLELASRQSEAIDWLSKKITADDYFGCWALPLAAEVDSKQRARYPTISSTRFESNGELAHRFVIRRLLGSLATEEHLDHICRVHACCNPLHLNAVTQATNTRRGIVARSSVVGQHRFDYSS